MFTRDEAKTIGQEVEDAIAEVLKRHGLRTQPRRVSYGEDLVVKLTLTKADQPDAYTRDFLRYADGFSIPKDALGKTIRSGHRSFVIIGLNVRARSMPLMARDTASGKVFKFRASAAHNAI